MTQLVNEPTLRGALSKAGRAAAEQLFSRRRLAEAMIPVYESVIGHRGAGEEQRAQRTCESETSVS